MFNIATKFGPMVVMTPLELTAWFIIGMLTMLAFLWIVNWMNNIGKSRREYMKSLSKEQLREYLDFMDKVN